MLNATVQKLADTTVIRCQGRIVVGEAYTFLRNAVRNQIHTRMLVLDLAQVDRIDAGGLGVLLGLREWAHSNAIKLRLMNVMSQIEQVLELTKLDHVFEFCSVGDMFHLLHLAASNGAKVGRSSEPVTSLTVTNRVRSVQDSHPGGGQAANDTYAPTP